MAPDVAAQLERAAKAIAGADALLVTAGAGMGVDSGLPDFRGTDGFWRAYPPLAKLGLRFEQMANPAWFQRDPRLAWGFYGHRLNLYRATVPHGGFTSLRRWAAARPAGHFVFTSNVDGQFQKAGFAPDRVVECHGSIHHLQCTRPCGEAIWPADDVSVSVDETTLRASLELPRCPRCGSLARPNVLMFGDGGWVESRSAGCERLYRQWLRETKGLRLTIVECGAGTAVPTVRLESERLARQPGATLVRINVREADVPAGRHVGLPMGVAAAVSAIEALGIK